jgi:tRNA threonylcarbamoyladenosine biosynthesis protein TsaB
VRVLGIETSTPQGSIAIVDGDEIVRESIWFSQKGHISLLPKFFSYLFEETGFSIKDIDLVAVSIGPGSFTGLRIGLGFAKGICFVHKKPLKGVSSLKVLASGVYLQSKIYPVLDAKRGYIYGGCYSWKGNLLFREMEDGLFIPEDFSKLAMDGVLVGNGVKRFEGVFSSNKKVLESHLQYPLAHNLCALAIFEYEREGEDDLFSLTPHYIAPPPVPAEKISELQSMLK